MLSFDRHSRRTVLGWGTATLALMPGAVRAAGAVAPAAPPAAPDAIQGDPDANHHLTIETHINGKGPFRFVVDTGADQTVISDDVAMALGLIAGEQVTVQGISRSVEAHTVPLNALSFGKYTIEHLRTPVLQRSRLGADGYLGLDVIDRRCVEFDFRNDKLTVTDSRASAGPRFVPPDEALVRVDGSHGRLTSKECRVDSVDTHAFVDSGAEASIGNTRLFAELQAIGKTYVDDELIPIMGVTGGQVFGRLVRIDSIELGELRFRNGVLLISDLPVFDVWGLSNRPAMFIGMNFLRQTSSFSIDYGNKELRIDLAAMRVVRAT
jgi:predicted aspartyl protease